MIVKKILNEYGSLVSNLCTDNESLLYITKHTNPKDAIYALSLLIQKRFIEPRKINNTVYYILQTKNIKRRLYFSLYLEFVEKEYGKTYSDSLYKILINGHYKVIDKVTMCKMVNYKLAEYISEPKPKEIKRIKKNDNKTIIDETDVQSEPDFIIANYGHIERKMFMNYFIDYIALHYDRNAKTIFESMVDCIPISLKNLTNLLGGSLGDDSYLIEKYVLMFKSDKIIEDDFAKDTYRLNIDNITQILKKYVINKYLEVNLDTKAKRIYNLLFEKHYIDDKEIVRFGLLDDKTMKSTLIELYKNGLIQINCVKNNKNGMLWECDFGKTCTMLCNILEGKIVNLIDKLKIDWNVVQTRDVLESDDSVYINDILLLSKMHFILSYDNSNKGLKK